MALDSKYDSSDMVYPRDLLSNESRYGSNYVVFFVNVVDSDRPQKDQFGGVQQTVPDFDSRVATAVQELNGVTTGGAVAGVFGQNALQGAGLGAIGSLIRGNISGAAKGALASGALAAAPIAILKLNGVEFSKGKKRLKKTIMMHMPNDIRTSYQMIYGEVDLKNFSVGVEAFNTIKDSTNKLLNNEGGKGSFDELRRLGAPASAVALSSPSMEGVQAATRLAPNPKKEILFNSVDFRSFQMAYQFFPKNKQEATMVENIILHFKYHMHPSFLDDKKFIYEYPSEFDISFYHGEAENTHLPKISSCALMSLDVDYSPNGVWGTSGDGTPVQINLVLHFRELSTLTKESIAKGY